ncbi:MAG TPA: hypothetical protein VGW40_03505 [Allosphingosinicella sp.]|nr:hypothetical protein [Allosphingosinicella sp.]
MAFRDSLRVMKEKALALLAAMTVAGCVAPAAEAPRVAPPALPPAPTYGTTGLQGVIGQSARSLAALFGAPDLDVREGTARKLQFLSPVCVLDAYLYPPRAGAEPLVTHIDTRLPDGRDIDRSSCVAALSRREEAR